MYILRNDKAFKSKNKWQIIRGGYNNIISNMLYDWL